MKRMMKKIGGLSLCAVMCAAALAGCGNSGGGGSSSDGTVTIKFVHKFPEEQRMAYFEEIIADFEEANQNIKIEMTAYGDEEIKIKQECFWAVPMRRIFSLHGAASVLCSMSVQAMPWILQNILMKILSGKTVSTR